MATISATHARQQWAQTLDQAKKLPVTITEHGRETLVLMDVDLARRALEALEALEDAEDAQEYAGAVALHKASNGRTYTLAEVAADLDIAQAQTFQVKVRRDGKWWYFEIPEVSMSGQARRFAEVEPEATDIIATVLQIDPATVSVTFDVDVRLPFPDLVSGLREILGVRLVAYIGGVKSARSVSTWADGTGTPSEVDRERVHHAFHAAALLRERYDATTVRSWFKGMNPSLDDDAPAHVLREGDPLEGARDVIDVAKAFANIG